MNIDTANVQELRQFAQELLAAAKEAERVIEATNKPSYRFHEMVREFPIERVGQEGIADGFIGVSQHKTDVWRCMLSMAKSIHDTVVFTERKDQSYRYGPRGRYFDSQVTKIRTLDQLSVEQISLSADMATELAEVYNKYFVMANGSYVVHMANGDTVRLPTVRVKKK